MFPVNTSHDSGNCSSMNAVLVSKRALARIWWKSYTLSYLHNLCARQFRRTGCFSMYEACLLLCIACVFLFGSKKEMIWSNTRRIVAAVQHTQVVRDRTVMQLPRKPVSLDVLVVDTQLSVPKRGADADPVPTLLGLVHVLPESSFWCRPAESFTMAFGHQVPPVLDCQGGRGRVTPSSTSVV